MLREGSNVSVVSQQRGRDESCAAFVARPHSHEGCPAHRRSSFYSKKKKKKNPSRGNPHLACVRPFGTKPNPPRTHRRAHTLVFCTDVSTISSLPFAALFPLFFNTHSIIYQRFFQDIRYAARIGFCPVVLASHCFPTLYKRCLRDCVFFCFSFAKYTTLCSVVDVTKWEKADGSKTKHHFLTRLFQVKAFFSSFFLNMTEKEGKKILLFTMFW